MHNAYFPLDAREYVREELKARQSRRSQYSLRAFARDLEMSPSFLCEFLAGRQGLSRARVLVIVEKIKLSREQGEHFWDLLQSRFAPQLSQRRAAEFRARARAKSVDSHLCLETFRAVAEWYHFPLLELLILKEVAPDIEEISAMLDVPVADLERARERMLAMGFLTAESVGGRIRYSADREFTGVGEGVADRAIQQLHAQALSFHAGEALKKPFSERENLTLTFSIDRQNWPELRQAMQKAILDVAAKYAQTEKPKDQVVSMSTQMLGLLPESYFEKAESKMALTADSQSVDTSSGSQDSVTV